MKDEKHLIKYVSPKDGLEVLSCSSDRPFASHLHDGFVLWFNSACGETYQLKGNSEILQPGSISIIEPETIHSNTPCSSEHRQLCSFYLSEKFVRSMGEKLPEAKISEPAFRNRVIQSRRLWHDLLRLHTILLNSPPGMEVDELLLSVFSRIGSGVEGVDSKHRSEDRRVAMAVEYLHAHFSENVTLEELASLANCTEYHLIRIFRSHRGLPPHSYLIQLRLEKARRMLLSGHSVADAALKSGFSDQSHLTRLFKTRYGLPPQKYLKSLHSPHWS